MVREAAAAAHVTERTVYRWLLRADFADAYRTATTRRLDVAAGALRTASTEAVAALRAAVTHGESHAVRTRAASEVLKHAFACTLDDIAARIEKLESALRVRDWTPPMGDTHADA